MLQRSIQDAQGSISICRQERGSAMAQCASGLPCGGEHCISLWLVCGTQGCPLQRWGHRDTQNPVIFIRATWGFETKPDCCKMVLFDINHELVNTWIA